MEPVRPFSAGSRQTPDPYDQFLEREGYYRKHTARDSTCLFRVVSEQIFDVQLYHEKVRADCVNFMRQKRFVYDKQIDGNFDDYLNKMSKQSSYGTFVELDALAHTYKCNIMLFEPYNCGSWFVHCATYKDVLMIFFSPDKHFDSIFPTSYIIQAAYCQALVYEILYVKVFKLPDVLYSVERMLHDPDDKTMKIEERRGKTGEMVEYRVATTDGRKFLLDTADDTECVLDNFRLCHFHNKENFSTIVDSYRHKKHERDSKDTRSIKSNTEKGHCSKDLILVNPMLCDKNISCVRQLLKEGITPFPYKVAKALDPSIYRNIEFDSWSDMRREFKYRNWYIGGNSLQVGVKCLVKLNETDHEMCCGYIQEMLPNNGPCLVYIEDIAECRTVPYESLQTLPPNQMRHWVLPYKSRKNAGINSTKILSENLTRKKIHSKIMDISLSKHSSFNYNGKEYVACCTEKSLCLTCNNMYGMHNIHPNTVEMVVLPFLINENRNSKSPKDPSTNDMNEISLNPSDIETDDTSSFGAFDMYSNSSIPCSTQSLCYTYNEPYPYDSVFTSNIYQQPYSYAPQAPFSYSIYGPPNTGINPTMTPQLGAIPVPTRVFEGIPNFHAVQSVSFNGNDLPFHDLVTLRYFFNLGIEYFRQNQFNMLPPVLLRSVQNNNLSCDEVDDVSQLSNNFEAGLNIPSNSETEQNSNQKPKGTAGSPSKNENHLPGKRKYACSKKTHKKGNDSKYCSNGNNIDTPFFPVKSHITNESAGATTNDNAQDYVETFSYGVPVYKPTSAYPISVPYYQTESNGVESIMPPPGPCYFPAYMLHPYGTVIAPTLNPTVAVSDSEGIIAHDNTGSITQAPDTQNTVNGNFHSVMYTSQQFSTGYTTLGYTQQQPLYNFSGSSICSRNNSGSLSNNSSH